jgi:hypothetical protein
MNTLQEEVAALIGIAAGRLGIKHEYETNHALLRATLAIALQVTCTQKISLDQLLCNPMWLMLCDSPSQVIVAKGGIHFAKNTGKPLPVFFAMFSMSLLMPKSQMRFEDLSGELQPMATNQQPQAVH